MYQDETATKAVCSGAHPTQPAAGRRRLNAVGGGVNKDGLANVVDALFILECEVGVKPGANMDFCVP
jgi:hypothetical protein